MNEANLNAAKRKASELEDDRKPAARRSSKSQVSFKSDEDSTDSIQSYESDKKPTARAKSSRNDSARAKPVSKASGGATPKRVFSRKPWTPERTASLGSGDAGKWLPARLDVKAHASGHILVIPKKTIRHDETFTLEQVELFWQPIKKMVANDLRDWNTNTGVSGMVTLRDLNGNPKKSDSDHPERNWEAMIVNSPNQTDWTKAEVSETQAKCVAEWNKYTNNKDVFRFKSKVQPGRLEANKMDPPTLDQTIISDDVVNVLKADFDIDDDSVLSGAEVDDIVGLYFKDIEDGCATIKSFAHDGPRFPELME